MGLVNHAGLVKARSNYFGVQSHIGHSRSTRARPCGCSRAELGEVDPLFTSKQISNTRKRKLFATLHPISNITCVHHGVNSNLIIHQEKTNSPKLSTVSSRHIGPDKTKPENETYSSNTRTWGVKYWKILRIVILLPASKIELFQHSKHPAHREGSYISAVKKAGKKGQTFFLIFHLP